ncbi:hypothetical protein F3D3_3034 [Fusibacter sp. 3D3]|nr:hypothetical protein F3D3_3034 [Fusibacter sp. 3D3]
MSVFKDLFLNLVIRSHNAFSTAAIARLLPFINHVFSIKLSGLFIYNLLTLLYHFKT